MAGRPARTEWRSFDFAPRRVGVSGSLRVAEFHSAGTHAFAPHAHERAHVSLLLSGSYRERCGSQALDHHPFFPAFHPPGFEHQDTFGEQGATLLIVELADVLTFERLPELRCGVPRPIESVAALAAALQLRATLLQRNLDCPLTAEGLALDLLTEATREERAATLGRPRWLREVKERLRSDYTRPIALSGLALDADVHLGHLWRVFRRAEGCSPSTYVQRLRCRHVLRELGKSGPETCLADLALEAGFCDQSHLTRVFGRVMGTSPGALIRALAIDSGAA